MSLLAGVMSQTGWDEQNSLQLAIGGLAALDLLGAATFAFVYAFSGAESKPLVVALAVAPLLVGVWLLGLATWCSSCGAP
jgi:Kef-type K+ transport system membrane component KefB